jgi:hypothetical protein
VQPRGVILSQKIGNMEKDSEAEVKKRNHAG